MSVDLDNLEALDKAATAGPWDEHEDCEKPGNCSVFSTGPCVVHWGAVRKADAVLIAAMRNALPTLLRAARDLAAVTAERDAARVEEERWKRHSAEYRQDWEKVLASRNEIIAERDAARAECERMKAELQHYRDLKKYPCYRGTYEDMVDERDTADRERRIAEVQRDASYAKGHEDGIAELRARLAEVERERDALRTEQDLIAASIGYKNPNRSQLINAIQQLVDQKEAHFRGEMNKHHECREHRARIRLLESLAEDARTCASFAMFSNEETVRDAGRRVLAGIGGK